MAKMRVIANLGPLVKKLGLERKETGKRLQRGMIRTMEFLKVESQKIVPVDKSLKPPHMWQLHDSARVTHSSFFGRFNTVVRLSYGTPYAVIQHENRRYKHAKGRSAKYLEIPIRTKRKQMVAILVKEMRGKRDHVGNSPRIL